MERDPSILFRALEEVSRSSKLPASAAVDVLQRIHDAGQKFRARDVRLINMCMNRFVQERKLDGCRHFLQLFCAKGGEPNVVTYNTMMKGLVKAKKSRRVSATA